MTDEKIHCGIYLSPPPAERWPAVGMQSLRWDAPAHTLPSHELSDGAFTLPVSVGNVSSLAGGSLCG